MDKSTAASRWPERILRRVPFQAAGPLKDRFLRAIRAGADSPEAVILAVQMALREHITRTMPADTTWSWVALGLLSEYPAEAAELARFLISERRAK